MADMKITEYNSHNAPATGDQFFMIGTAEEYRIDYDKLANAILDKLTSKTYSDINNNVISAIAALNSNFAVTDITAQIQTDSSYISVSALDVKKCGRIVYVSIEFSVTQEIPAYTVILSEFPQSMLTTNVIIGYGLNNNVFYAFYMKAGSSLAPRAKIPKDTKVLIYLNYLT